jgi:predicted dehydrogenase
MSAAPLTIAVIGLGARARTWLKVIAANPDLRLVALSDPAEAARTKAAELCPGVPVMAGLAEALQTRPDAVLLCTPPGGRAAQIEAACRAGSAILAEKPLADSLAEAAVFVRMAEDAGVPLIVGLNFRYLAVTQGKRDLLRSGAAGRPEFGRFLYERWRDGTQPQLNKYPMHMVHPMLWEQSVHHFDLMRFVYGTDARRVMAQTWNPSWSHYDGDTNVAALWDFENGMRLTYQGTWQAGLDRLDFDWRTDGSEGVVAQHSMFGDLTRGLRSEGKLSPVPLPPHEPWISDAEGLLAAFVRTLRGTAAPECTGRDHLHSLAMVEACIAASARGEAVWLEEFADLTGPQQQMKENA